MAEPDDISPEKHAYWEGRAESEQELSRLRAELARKSTEYSQLEDAVFKYLKEPSSETRQDLELTLEGIGLANSEKED